MGNRILRESICQSVSINSLTWFEEVFFYRLIVNCDDYGRMDARPSVLKSKLFTLKKRISLRDIQRALEKLADVGCIKLYERNNQPFLYIPTWTEYQRVRNKICKYPEPLNKVYNNLDSNSRRVAANCGELLPEYESEFEYEFEYESESNYARAHAETSAETDPCAESLPESGQKTKQKHVDYKQIQELFNSICVSYTPIKAITDKRRQHIKARIDAGHTLDEFKQVFNLAENSDFLKGLRETRDVKKPWKCSFDWIIGSEEHFVKILEGRYNETAESAVQAPKWRNADGEFVFSENAMPDAESDPEAYELWCKHMSKLSGGMYL